MSSYISGGTDGARPELSNLTMEYLKNTSINLNNDTNNNDINSDNNKIDNNNGNSNNNNE